MKSIPVGIDRYMKEIKALLKAGYNLKRRAQFFVDDPREPEFVATFKVVLCKEDIEEVVNFKFHKKYLDEVDAAYASILEKHESKKEPSMLKFHYKNIKRITKGGYYAYRSWEEEYNLPRIKTIVALLSEDEDKNPIQYSFVHEKGLKGLEKFHNKLNKLCQK